MSKLGGGFWLACVRPPVVTLAISSRRLLLKRLQLNILWIFDKYQLTLMRLGGKAPLLTCCGLVYTVNTFQCKAWAPTPQLKNSGRLGRRTDTPPGVSFQSRSPLQFRERRELLKLPEPGTRDGKCQAGKCQPQCRQTHGYESQIHMQDCPCST